MPTFGICAPPAQSAAVKAAGWAYVEGNVQSHLQGTVDDADWTALADVRSSVLPMPAANALVPGNLRIVGPDADPAKVRAYMSNVLRRAGQIKMNMLVFGSAGARNVPEGFDRGRARSQIVDFIRMAAPIAAEHGVTIVAEPLNKRESNIINTVSEAMTYVKEVNHPNFQCLVDSYHFWLEDEPLENLADAMPRIKHVHLADKIGRVAPGLSGQSDYKPFFKVLKAGGYDALISYEGAAIPDFETTAPRILDYVKREWDAA